MKISAFSKTYDGAAVLDFPGMELKPGTVYAIIGANGSGKSTLAKILAGVLSADRRGKLMDAATVGYMPQKNYAFRMSAKANILLNGKDEARANSLMDALQIRHLEHKRADKLSGGETARMALARLMMRSYDVVILDEPTAGLDPVGRESLLGNILAYREKKNATIIMVSHSMEEIASTVDRLYVMNHGTVAMTGKPQEIFDRADELVQIGLNVPQITTVFRHLRELGVQVPNVYTIEQALDVLLSMKGGAKSC